MKIITVVGVIAVAGLIGYTTTNAVLKNKISENNVAEISSTIRKNPTTKKDCTVLADSYNKKAAELNAAISQYKNGGCYNHKTVNTSCKTIGDTALTLRKEVDMLRKTYEECVILNDEQPKYIKK